MVSVIVPVWNDAPCLLALLSHLENEPGPLEIIVVDGGSTDEVRQVAARFPRVRLLFSSRGRSRQMNAGAHAASGETLLFLHSDTLPPCGAVAELPVLLRSTGADFGAYRLRFNPPYFLPQCLALFTGLAWHRTCFGDQGVFVRKSFFDATGGFPDIPVLEDVHWLRKAAKVGRMIRSPHTIVTSARRFQRVGQVRQTLRNAWILLRDRFGADPAQLAELFQRGYLDDRQPPRAMGVELETDSLSRSAVSADRA